MNRVEEICVTKFIFEVIIEVVRSRERGSDNMNDKVKRQKVLKKKKGIIDQ